MATSIRQMLKVAGANMGTVSVVIQKGVGPWPMPGVQRTDTYAALGTQGVVVPNTDPLWDKRITSQFDMPRCVGYDTNTLYWPVCISQHDPYFHLIRTDAATSYIQASGNQPIHIITDLAFQPWLAYQGTVEGRINAVAPQ